MYSGYTPFPISTRNSATAVVHLIRSTGIQQLFISPDPAMQNLMQQARDILRADGYDIQLLSMPQFQDLYKDSANNGHEEVQQGKMDGESITLILHSSGE